MLFTAIAALAYAAIVIISYLYFYKWVAEFSGEEELSTKVWAIVIIAAAAIPTLLLNCTGFLISIASFLVMLF